MLELFDFEGYLLRNYKYFGINEDELVTLIQINDLLKEGNKLLTSELLSLRMTKKKEEIDQILLSLMNKGFVEFENSKKGLRTSIDPLKKKLLKRYSLELTRSEEETEERNAIINRVSQFINSKLDRKMLPVEYEQLAVWLNACYSEDEIINAVEDCLKLDKTSFYYFNIKLVEYRRNKDLRKEGFTTATKPWDKDFEETMEILKTKWVEPND